MQDGVLLRAMASALAVERVRAFRLRRGRSCVRGADAVSACAPDEQKRCARPSWPATTPFMLDSRGIPLHQAKSKANSPLALCVPALQRRLDRPSSHASLTPRATQDESDGGDPLRISRMSSRGRMNLCPHTALYGWLYFTQRGARGVVLYCSRIQRKISSPHLGISWPLMVGYLGYIMYIVVMISYT